MYMLYSYLSIVMHFLILIHEVFDTDFLIKTSNMKTQGKLSVYSMY